MTRKLRVQPLWLKTCVATVEAAVYSGTITDALAMTLALRSLPLISTEGDDEVAKMGDEIANQIAIHKDQVAFDNHLLGVPDSSIISSPFTELEINAVLIKDGRKAFPTMNKFRSIPVDPSTAYILTAADTVIHPARYLSPGMTLAQSVHDARTRHSAEDDRILALVCMTDDGSLNLQNCQAAAARNTAEMILNGEAASYNPGLYRVDVR